MFKNRGPSFIIFLIILLCVCIASAQQKTVRVGVVIDGPWEQNDEISEMTQREILTLTEGEFDVRFPANKTFTADWTLASIHAAVDRLLADSEVDLILTMGVLASGYVSRRGDLPKPVIAPFVIDAHLQGLPSKDGTSGVRNLNYLSLPARVFRDVRLFREIVSFTKLAILVNNEVWQSIPDFNVRVDSSLQAMGIEPTLVAVGRTVDSALSLLAPETEAVYIAPLLHLEDGEFDRLVKDLIKKKIPSFSLFGVPEVERGLFATASPDIFPKLTRRVALNVQRILLGEDPGTFPTAFAVGEQITINMQTARAIRVSPPFTVMTEAETISEERKVFARSININGVMQEAIDKNLDLLAEMTFVSAGEQNIKVARSLLLPQIAVSGLGLVIDKDRAQASFGSQAERTLTGTARASQLVFSEPALANLSIQKHLQKSREAEYDQLRLDISQEAATAYLNVLRAKTFEKIQKENLKRTRSNLDLAQVREAIGYSGPAEVYRWESQIANARKDVIEIIAQRNLAEISLNRLLHRPLEESFEIEDVDISDPTFAISNKEIATYFDDLFSFKTFRAFMVGEGLAHSPEIQALDAVISAKERELRSVSRSFFSPTIALQMEISKLFNEGGAGTEGLQLPATFPAFPEADETNWSIGLNLSLPIFEGSGRFAERTRANKELQDLRLTRESVVEKIEQRIRSALHVGSASRTGIQLARDAAEAANKNLDLVTDAYSRGAVNILDLLDAQNAALNADLAASNAVYGFLIDFIELERAVGRFYFFVSEQEKDAWFQRLKEFFEKAGMSPSGR